MAYQSDSSFDSSDDQPELLPELPSPKRLKLTVCLDLDFIDDNVLLAIFAQCDLETILALAYVCHRFNRIIGQNEKQLTGRRQQIEALDFGVHANRPGISPSYFCPPWLNTGMGPWEVKRMMIKGAKFDIDVNSPWAPQYKRVTKRWVLVWWL